MFMFLERRLCQDVDKVPGYSASGGLYHENEEYFSKVVYMMRIMKLAIQKFSMTRDEI